MLTIHGDAFHGIGGVSETISRFAKNQIGEASVGEIFQHNDFFVQVINESDLARFKQFREQFIKFYGSLDSSDLEVLVPTCCTFTDRGRKRHFAILDVESFDKATALGKEAERFPNSPSLSIKHSLKKIDTITTRSINALINVVERGFVPSFWKLESGKVLAIPSLYYKDGSKIAGFSPSFVEKAKCLYFLEDKASCFKKTKDFSRAHQLSAYLAISICAWFVYDVHMHLRNPFLTSPFRHITGRVTQVALSCIAIWFKREANELSKIYYLAKAKADGLL